VRRGARRLGLLSLAVLAAAVPAASARTSAPILWRSCGAPFECASLRVPIDYAHPGNGSMQVALTRLRATGPGRRIGSLLLNPGGPGEPGGTFLHEIVGLASFRKLRQRFDLVSFDPRGTGGSGALHCLDDRGLDRFFASDPLSTTAAGLRDVVDTSRAFASGCAAHAGRLLPFVDSRSVARDLDRIRAAVGDPKLTYLGLSYGTFLGAQYLRLFPRRVRALVLDGVVDPSLTTAQRAEVQANALEGDLDDFFAWCVARPTLCALARDGVPRTVFDRLLEQLGRAKLKVGPRLLGRDETMQVVATALYAPQQYASLANALDGAVHGDGRPLLAGFDFSVGRGHDGHYGSFAASYLATTCLDGEPLASVHAYEQLAARLARVAPHFGAATAYTTLPCLFWPVRPRLHPAPLVARGVPRLLVLGATGDPATPLSESRSLVHQLPGSILLTRRGDGHTSFTMSPCVSAAATTYLVSLQLPRPGTTCD
jgi:pimeloyl-ACP methyl ester carboxylesterase